MLMDIDHYTGETMEESLKKLQDAIHPPLQNGDIDVEIDSLIELIPQNQ